MLEKHGKLKIVCVAIAALVTLFLSSSEAGDPGQHGNPPVSGREDGDAWQAMAEKDASKTGEPDTSASDESAPVNMIEDVQKWDNPVKDVFRAEGIAVRSIELLKDGTYPIFHVILPFELTYENEARTTALIEKIASSNSWWDFELIDNAKDDRIIVTCDRQYDMVDEVMINGDRNYFVRLLQKKALENYAFIKPLDIKTPGMLLKLVMGGGWKHESLIGELGESDSSFDGYDIYFDKGISIKWSGDRINNIVLNSNYMDDVLKGIDFNDGRKEVVGLLGTPQFEDTGEELFGYKAANFYIFFRGTERLREISIYSRNTGYDKDSLKNVLEKHGGALGKVDLVALVEDLKSQWPEYDLYYNERGGLGITYDSIGVSINNMYEYRGGPCITVFGNFEGAVGPALYLPEKTEGLGEYSNDMILLRLDTDSIFAAEKARLERAGYLNGRRQEEGVLSPDGSMKVLDNEGGTYEHAGLFVLSIDGTKPDIELHTGQFAGKAIWLDNRYFAYDVSMLGVFVYDTRDKKALDVLQSDLEADADYELLSYEAGMITMRNISDDSRHYRKCTFSEDGTLNMQ